MRTDRTYIGIIFKEMGVENKVSRPAEIEVLYTLVKEDMRRYVCLLLTKKTHPIHVKDFFTKPVFKHRVCEHIQEELKVREHMDKRIEHYTNLLIN